MDTQSAPHFRLQARFTDERYGGNPLLGAHSNQNKCVTGSAENRVPPRMMRFPTLTSVNMATLG